MKTLKNKVAIVTGAGGGLGRTHALELARLGANVVVNDLGNAAFDVAAEITEMGGNAIGVTGDVSKFEDMESLAQATIDKFSRIDILINNAGILRDRTFAKMPLEDWRTIIDVHLMGSVHATKAVWDHMKEQNFGRIVMTTSSTGLFGNFGQSNYGAAKLALVGLMNTLQEEGAKYNIRVNSLAPTAVTNMTAGLLPAEATEILTSERVSKGLLALVNDDAPSGITLLAGGGSFECANITMTQGIHIADDEDPAQTLVQRLNEVMDTKNLIVPKTGWDQSKHELDKAMKSEKMRMAS